MNAVAKLDAPVGDIPATLTANFMQVASGVDVGPLLEQVLAQPELWNKNPCRLSKRGPHHETQDMILRYRDEAPFLESGDWSGFNDPHIAIWNKTSDYLPAARPLIFNLMAHVLGEVLCGVFLYKIEPGKRIYPHIDPGWHAAFTDKFNICLSSNPQTRFQYEDNAMVQTAGDVHWFRNDVMHEVLNEGDTDHIVLTVCVAIDRGQRAPWSPAGWSMDNATRNS
jgi:quercetin dioxygenase-like cupin family protein